MEDQEGESLDGSSIKPVSSLRSHFEQMAKSAPTTTVSKPTIAPPRPISPKPKKQGPGSTASAPQPASKTGQATLQPPGLNDLSNSVALFSSTRQRPSSTGPFSQALLSPLVTVEPPGSPPRMLNKNITLSGPTPLLATDGPRISSTSSASSPQHFRISSRSNTPLPEPRKPSPTPMIQPPEPPPPRRSGELRRDAPLKTTMGPPPPINRAEKPKPSARQSPHTQHVETVGLMPATPPSYGDQASPFSTPPSSDSSPGPDSFPNPLPGIIPVTVQYHPRSSTPVMTFDPPPIHHSLLSLRKDQESNGRGRGAISPQITSDIREQRPALPIRPSISTTASSPARTSIDILRPSKDIGTPIDTLGASKSGTSTPQYNESKSSFPIAPTSFPILPKRNFSTPTSQLKTPPRSHGRSMTVDQTGDRVPPEFRTTSRAMPGNTDDKQRVTINKVSTAEVVPEPLNSIEYPSTSLSNRRPPHFKHGTLEILTKYDTRIIDVCGEYVCTSGYHTKVWSLRDGEQIISLSHGETIKMLSIAFKAAASPNEEGSRLWLGNNLGELLEIKIMAQIPVVATNSTAHNRREVVKIYRHVNEMWTLDESGTLHIWAPDKTGSPNLEAPSATYRVPKGHSFSMVVKDELWHAVGEEIRVFRPTVDGKSQFQLLQRPLFQPGVGEVTTGAVLSSQPERIYFGHTDGKVSIYSLRNYTCIGTVNVSMYKINSLAGVGDYLWAAYNTGMMYIYDITQVPWVVKKDWRAHVNPVINIIFDRSSFWKTDRYQVISLGADNAIKPWDGLLQEDWLEAELQARDESYCKLEQIRTLIMTWNAGASTPHSLRFAEQDKTFFPNLLTESGVPDILVFGFQELVDLEDKKTTAKSFFSKSKKRDPSEQEYMSHQYRDWRDYIIRCLDDSTPRDELYHLLHSANLVGLFTCVFVRAELRDRISRVSAVEVKRGLGGRAGNKGALVLRFMVDDTSMCFINCHLAAGQNQTKDRNFDVSSILDSTLLPIEDDDNVRLNSYIGGGDGTMILDHEICILSGDLNYRIDTMSRDAVINALKSGKIDKLLERDQLLASKRKRPGFRLRAFYEMPIDFAPTYKYDVGSDMYDTSEKKRAPAWCDRILSRGRNRQRLAQLNYRRHEVRVSDHRPVTGLFVMTVKKISHEKRAMVWEECRRRFEDIKNRVGASAQLDFLMSICGLDSEGCKRLLLDHELIAHSKESFPIRLN